MPSRGRVESSVIVNPPWANEQDGAADAGGAQTRFSASSTRTTIGMSCRYLRILPSLVVADRVSASPIAASRCAAPTLTATRDTLTRMAKPATIGELRAAGYQDRTVKDELRGNLLAKLERGEELFAGIVGFDDEVLPALERGILAGHDLILLGERGQAKTRLVRAIVYSPR